MLKPGPETKRTSRISRISKLIPGMEDLDFDELLFDGEKEADIHKCKIFGPLKDGPMEVQDKIPLFRDVPSKVDDFVGR